MRDVTFSVIPHSGVFCCLLIAFANSLDPGQDGQKCNPDLNPSCLTL